MGFTKPDLPDVDPDTFMQLPLMHRMKVLALHWAEHGFGTPRMVHAIYIVKLLFFYILGGVVVATATSGLPPFWHVAAWWNQPVVYEKAVLWTVLLETIGVAGSWGPLAGQFKPMTGGIRYWARPGTIRLPPWKRVPLTAGDRRTARRRRALPRARRQRRSSPWWPPACTAPRCPPRYPATPPVWSAPCSSSRRSCFWSLNGPARQDHLPGRARRAVPAGAGVLHRPVVRRHDHRAQAADRHGVGRGRVLEARAGTSRTSCRRWSATAVASRSGGSSARTTVTSPATSARPGLAAPDGPRRRDLRRDHHAAGAAASRGTRVTLAAVGRDGAASTCSSSRRSRWPCR